MKPIGVRNAKQLAEASRTIGSTLRSGASYLASRTRHFVAALFDLGSVRKKNEVSRGQALLALVGGLSAVIACLNAVGEFAMTWVGIPGHLSLLVVQGVLAVGCGHIFVANRAADPVVHGASIQREYAYGQPLRWTAKIVFVLLFVVLPGNLVETIRELTPLPTRFSGFILDAADGTPVVGAKVRAVSHDGVDLTASSLDTDSAGFYVIETQQSIERSGHLRVTIDSSEVHVLSLRHRNEIDGLDGLSHSAPVFRHYVPLRSRDEPR